MSTLKLTDGDLTLTNNSLVVETDLVAETAQRLTIKFNFFLGEWVLNPKVGIPLYEKVFIKNPKIPVLRSLFRQIIVGDPAVDTMNSLLFDFVSRQLVMDFEATLNDGSTLTFADFVLEENT